MGIAGGYLVEAGGSRGREAAPHASHTSNQVAVGWHPRPWRAGLEHALEVVGSVWAWLVLGILLSAAISAYLPPDLFSSIAGYGSWTTGLAALLFGLPLYVCATASVPIAAALLTAGLPMGSALIFLMAGPATNVATMGAVYRAFGRRVLAIYLGTIIVGSMGLGELFNRLFAATAIAAHAHVHVASWWEQLSALLLVAVIGYYAWSDLRRYLARRAAKGAAASIAYTVTGMNCDNCAAKLEGKLRAVPGVDFASVSFAQSSVQVGGTVAPARLEAEISKAGYTATRVAHG